MQIGSYLDKVNDFFVNLKDALTTNASKIKEIFENIKAFTLEAFDIFSSIISNLGLGEGLLDDDESLYDVAKMYEFAAEKGISRDNYENFTEFKEELKKENYEKESIVDKFEKKEYEQLGAALIKNEIDIKAQSNIPENLLVRLGQMNVDLKNANLSELGKIVNNYDLTNGNLEKYENYELPLYKREEIKEGINEIVKLSESNINKIENYDDIVEKNGSLFS